MTNSVSELNDGQLVSFNCEQAPNLCLQVKPGSNHIVLGKVNGSNNQKWRVLKNGTI